MWGVLCECSCLQVQLQGERQMELRAGDALLIDCRLLHRGGANTSSIPRAVLCVAWQCGDVHTRIQGYTYHLAPDRKHGTTLRELGRL